MGKGKKKEKKTGKKKSKLGKQVSKDAAARKDHLKIVQWRNKVKNLVFCSQVVRAMRINMGS